MLATATDAPLDRKVEMTNWEKVGSERWRFQVSLKQANSLD